MVQITPIRPLTLVVGRARARVDLVLASISGPSIRRPREVALQREALDEATRRTHSIEPEHPLGSFWSEATDIFWMVGSVYPGEHITLVLDWLPVGHPADMQIFTAELQRLLEERPGLQVIAPCISPDMANTLPEYAGVCCVFSPEQVAFLHEHPEASHWVGSLRPGEFWSTVGEDWVPTLNRGRQ